MLVVFLLCLMKSLVMGETRYVQLPSDTLVGTTPQTLLSLTFTLPQAGPILLVSDGRFFPSGPTTTAGVYISSNSTPSASTFIDWRDSQNPLQHSFSLVDGLSLGAGAHTVSLVAFSAGSTFAVGAGSNLWVWAAPPGVRLSAGKLSSDTQTFSFTVWPVPKPLPHSPVLSVTLPASPDGTLLALASGRSYASGTQGDAMWAIYLNHRDEVYNNQTLHTDNDLWSGAESGNAPMYTYAYFDGLEAGRDTTISLDAMAEPWPFCCNNVQYRIGAGLSLVGISGLGVLSRAVLTDTTDVLAYICVGTSKGWPGCPPVGPDFLFASTSFVVPDGHSGEVAVVSKSLVQPDESDEGGVVLLLLRVDGKPVGSVGVQEVKPPSSVSTRTITASWLSSEERLSPGVHTAEAYVRTTGSFIHLSFSRDLPLIVFG